MKIKAPSPDSCDMLVSFKCIGEGRAALTQSCDEADTVWQRKGQAEGVKLRLDCRITVHCGRSPSDGG